MEKLLPDIAANSTESAVAAKHYGPYPAYRDSGVEWLGEIPAHWGLKRLRFTVTKCQNGLWGDEPDGESDVVCVRVADFDRVVYRVKAEHLTLRSVNRSALRTHGLNSGDLLLEKSGGGESQPVGTVVLNTYGEAAICSNFIARMPVKDGFDSRYLTYVHAALYTARVNSRSIKQNTGIQNLDSHSYLNESIAFPELQEQCVIATYLDGETAKLDALGTKKERLIELLQEKRTALITCAVTKGIDPDAPMRNSGVEWPGEIPKDWEVKENRWLFRESDLRSVDGSEELLTVSHITGVTRRSDKPDVTMIEAESHEGYKLCHAGDLAINTMWAWMGVLGVAFEDGMVSPSYNVYRITRNTLLPDYFDYLCRIPTYVVEVTRHSKGIWSSRLRLYPGGFRNMNTPLPPTCEQRAIVDFLDEETEKIDTLVAKVQEAIDRLKELRTALIAAAVTGKIDVRKTPA